MPDDGDLILAIDQGTSATKAVLIETGGRTVAQGHASLAQQFPQPGWVEQSPVEIWESVGAAVAECLRDVDASRVRSIGLASQRESMLLWERRSGEPVGPMLGWQDQRSRGIVAKLQAEDAGVIVRERTGLVLDPMFSAAKAAWLLDRYDPRRERSRAGELLLGTVDSWLMWKLGGEHAIELGNASRTQLLDLRTRTWDDELLELFRVPREALPEIVASDGPFPAARGISALPDGTPVGAILGDSHAALLVHGRRDANAVKATYGTGSSVMALVDDLIAPQRGLCLTLAWDVDGPQFAFEGNIRASAATLAWLAKVLEISEAELVDRAFATTSDGVHLVPAFTGLGAPWWDTDATAIIRGFTFAAGSATLCRAAVESIAFQIEDVVRLVEAQRGEVSCLLADGGPAANPQLMQMQADISGRCVKSYADTGLSALGAAHLAGVSSGLWSWEDVAALEVETHTFEPQGSDDQRMEALDAWHGAIAQSRTTPPGSAP